MTDKLTPVPIELKPSSESESSLTQKPSVEIDPHEGIGTKKYYDDFFTYQRSFVENRGRKGKPNEEKCSTNLTRTKSSNNTSATSVSQCGPVD